MLPGMILIKKCTHCGEAGRQRTLRSGNTFGAVFWTDGKREAPMLPDEPWLVVCPHCRTPLWIDTLDVLGEIDPWEDPPGINEPARTFETPDFDDYLRVLDTGNLSADQERYCRQRAWWAGNDHRRRAPDGQPLSDREARNVLAFARLLDEAEAGQRVLKAEALFSVRVPKDGWLRRWVFVLFEARAAGRRAIVAPCTRSKCRCNRVSFTDTPHCGHAIKSGLGGS